MDFEQQLSNSQDPPLSQAVVDYLTKMGEPPDEGDLGQRFVWEIRRGKPPLEALQAARFARAVTSPPARSAQEGISAIASAVARRPLELAAGEHRPLDDDGKLTVVNLSEQPLVVSAGELQMAFDQLTRGRPLTVVLEEHDEASVRAGDGDALIWTLPTQPASRQQPWVTLAQAVGGEEEIPVWVQAVVDHRYPVSVSGTLPDEHQVRSDRIRGLVAEILSFFDYGTPGALHPLDEGEAMWLLDLVDEVFDRYTAQPRVVLSCANLANLGPAEEWQIGPRNLRSLVNLVTGDDRLVSAALASVNALRAGTLAFAGDPDNDGSELLNLTLPAGVCSVVLRPQVLDRVLFLTGRPDPTADLPVPQRRYGFYSTVASHEQVRDMLRTRVYLELSPAFPPHSRAYFQGRDQQLGLSQGERNLAFRSLVSGIASARDAHGELDAAALEQPLRVAVARALHQVLAAQEDDALCGLVLGTLSLDDVEEVVVALGSVEEFHHYLSTGDLPFYLLPAREFFDEHGIRLRPRPPVQQADMEPVA